MKKTRRTYEFGTGMIDMRDLLKIWLKETGGDPEASIETVNGYGDSILLEMEWEEEPTKPPKTMDDAIDEAHAPQRRARPRTEEDLILNKVEAIVQNLTHAQGRALLQLFEERPLPVARDLHAEWMDRE